MTTTVRNQNLLENRREALRRVLDFSSLGAVILKNPANIRYYSGFSGDDSWLVIGKQHEVLLTDGRYTAQAALECPKLAVLCQGGENGTWLDLLREVLTKWEVLKFAIEGDSFSYCQFNSLKKALSELNVQIFDAGRLPDIFRMLKDDTEVAKLKKVAKIGDKVLHSVDRFLRVGVSEKRLAAEIDYAFKICGAEGLAFPTIVAAGINGAKPHAKPSDYEFQNGDLVTIDMGGIYQGYCGDMTRTFAIGSIDERQRALYDLVLTAQKRAVAMLKPGMTCGEADGVARDVIAAAGYGDYFSHSLGHGVGLEIHESPNLRQGSEESLEIGNVVTVEPGIYIPDWGGIRIEDTVIIGEGGAEVITAYPKDLVIKS